LGMCKRMQYAHLVPTIACAIWLTTQIGAAAQIVPDATLPSPSTVNIEESLMRITGGSQAGSNLFHSFEQFNIRTGETVYFDHAPNLDAIITRVTGGHISNIDGLLRTNGIANVFLINPSGIVFGPQARLDIGGSFFASSADSLQFADGLEFSATDPIGADGRPPLLSVNVPVGLQYGATPGAIASRANLSILPRQTLALLGGNLELNGSQLTAIDGQIVLGSIAREGRIEFADWVSTGQQGSIQLTGGAIADTSGNDGGTIHIRGDRIGLTERSQLLANTFGNGYGGGIHVQGREFNLQQGSLLSASTFGTGNAGGVQLTADAIDLQGTNPGQTLAQFFSGTPDPTNLTGGIYSFSLSAGASGDISVEADRINLGNGANLVTITLNQGEGGEISIRATESLQLSDVSLLATTTIGEGKAGNLTLDVGTLRVLSNAIIATSPGNPKAGGQGGNLTAIADRVELVGGSGALFPSGLFTTTLGAGKAGDLTLVTDRLRVTDGAQISVASAGAGAVGNLNIRAREIELSGFSPDGRYLSGLLASSGLIFVRNLPGSAQAGNITVETERLTLNNGAQISAATGNQEGAGNIRIQASHSVSVVGQAIGVAPQVEEVSFGVFGDGIVASGIEANTGGAGNAGSLYISTDRLLVSDGAEVGVRGTSTGAAGNLEVVADTIRLENRGSIAAATVAGSRGNIQLTTDTIQLLGNSRIATDSRSTSGGNIRITTNTLVALDNSDITANAITDRGGNINIQTLGLFGIQASDRLTTNSDITATSQIGLNGRVELDALDIAPQFELSSLIAEVLDPATLITKGCREYQGSQFTIAGRGGLPPTPTQPLSNDRAWQDLRFLEEDSEPVSREPSKSDRPHSIRPDLGRSPQAIEADGWHVLPDGRVQLIATQDGQSWYEDITCGQL
jgi:filamentous hemagglutinin family protein